MMDDVIVDMDDLKWHQPKAARRAHSFRESRLGAASLCGDWELLLGAVLEPRGANQIHDCQRCVREWNHLRFERARRAQKA
jgi:hypothetical protein